MPELPEVEVIRRGLGPALVGLKIKEIETRRPDLRIPFPAEVQTVLRGQRIHACLRRAKYLIFEFDHDYSLILHLGMSGRLRHVCTKSDPVQKHDHFLVHFDNGESLIFNDARRFGMVLLLHTSKRDTHKAFSHLGPEPLDETFTGSVLYARLQSRRSCMPIER